MRNFMLLARAVDYIETNLCEPFSRSEVAAHCYVSLSLLEKLFRRALGMGLRDYTEKRRMTQAAKALVLPECTVTELAMRFQFSSAEVFSRAFKRVWRVNPSEFKEHWKFTGIFPKITCDWKEGEDWQMARKRVDLSEAYDFLKARKGTYVLCFDVKHLIAFNEISLKAGDMAILEAAARIDKAAGSDMLLLRIGSDEFALVTGLGDKSAAQALAAQILSQNGLPIVFEGKELPLFLWCGMAEIPENLRYDAFFKDMHSAIQDSKA